MLKTLLLASAILQAISPNIEVFDIDLSKVTKITSSSKQIQGEVLVWLKSINGIDGKVKFEPPPHGVMIKIPLSPPLKIENVWVNEVISEVYLIYSKNEKARLLLFTRENKVMLVYFEADPTPFVKRISTN
ncbi:hypothetical protein [Paenibacillus andongensis]|uniref:hypothetical protein n=1 Tax=Paenibacillus andongensis TaxID=2975482 RepID=UPI0021BBA863|nr:hypothetical protein [Paenibacillus andongensis]